MLDIKLCNLIQYEKKILCVGVNHRPDFKQLVKFNKKCKRKLLSCGKHPCVTLVIEVETLCVGVDLSCQIFECAFKECGTVMSLPYQRIFTIPF